MKRMDNFLFVKHMCLCVCVCVCFHAHMPVAQVLLFATPWTVAHQAPLSMVSAKQECWSGLGFPSPGDLPNQGIEPASPVLAGRFFIAEPAGNV